MDISLDDIEFFYECYANTYYVRGQKPYLTQAFFLQLVQQMPQCLMLVKAYQSGKSVAAALFKDDKTLYGRYWGAVEHINCLHFEVCYYQGIEYAIKHQLAFFDPARKVITTPVVLHLFILIRHTG